MSTPAETRGEVKRVLQVNDAKPVDLIESDVVLYTRTQRYTRYDTDLGIVTGTLTEEVTFHEGPDGTWARSTTRRDDD